MTDFETHPAGTADLVKQLREKQICTGFEQVEPGVIDCVYSGDPVCLEAADRIEQLEAALTRAIPTIDPAAIREAALKEASGLIADMSRIITHTDEDLGTLTGRNLIDPRKAASAILALIGEKK